MKTIEELVTYKSKCIDQRDIYRLFNYLPNDTKVLETFLNNNNIYDKDLNEILEVHNAFLTEYTINNVLNEAIDDCEFGIEKAIDKRGISSALMFNVIEMWMWVLDIDYTNDDSYSDYGLTFFNNCLKKLKNLKNE